MFSDSYRLEKIGSSLSSLGFQFIIGLVCDRGKPGSCHLILPGKCKIWQNNSVQALLLQLIIFFSQMPLLVLVFTVHQNTQCKHIWTFHGVFVTTVQCFWPSVSLNFAFKQNSFRITSESTFASSSAFNLWGKTCISVKLLVKFIGFSLVQEELFHWESG